MKYGIVALLALFFLVNCEEKEAAVKPLLDYVPEEASFILKIKDHNGFLATIKENDFLTALKGTKTYQNIFDKIAYLQYVQPNSESILTFIELDNNTFDFVYITEKNSNLFELDSVKSKLIEDLKIGDALVKKYTLNKATFYGIEDGNKFIISSSEALLTKTNKTAKLPKTQLLKKLYRSTSVVKPASFLINLNNSGTVLSSVLKPKSELDISGFSDWISLDLNEDKNNLHLSGISIANDSTWNFIDLLANTKPAINKTPIFAPATADAIISYTYDSYPIFAKNRELSTGQIMPSVPELDAIEEIGIIYVNGHKNVLLNTYGAENIADYLKNDRRGSIEYQGNEILELRKTDFLDVRFSPIIKNYKAKYCTFIKNAFVFSEDQASLKLIIKNYKDATTYNKTSDYKTIENELAKESSILALTNSKNINKILKEEFTADFANDIKKVHLSDYAYAVQTITDKSFYHTNVVIQKIEGSLGKTGISPRYSVKLPGEIAAKPQFVVNHLNNTKEIVVQDLKNVLYLISSKGKIIWKKQLESQIQGKIHQVDIFKNGRLQLAFTTFNQFMILDRNGKEVKQFTNSYTGGNLNELAVFDYEKKKNYRFVVTQNKKTFMYDSKANIVKGFKFTEAEQPIIAAPKHLVIGNKDYLAFKLKDGTLKLLNRVGDVRTNVSEKIDFSDNELFVYKDRFTLTDKKGTLFEIDQNGKIRKTTLHLSTDHGMFATNKSLVTMNDNVLNIKGKELELEMGVYTKPEIFYINGKVYVSVTDLQNEKVYLFDSLGKSIAGFPINGTSKIDLTTIENDKVLDLITQKDSNTIIRTTIN